MQADQEKLASLEREIDLATERLWQAKLEFKQAKVLVKLARKARKQLRKEHVRLGEQLSNSSASERTTKKNSPPETLKIADSPERTKAPRKKVKLSSPSQSKEPSAAEIAPTAVDPPTPA